MARNSKNTATAILLALTFSMMLVSSSLSANAQLQIETYAHLSVAPNPVGVGQTLTVVMWLDKPPPTPRVQTNTLRALPYKNFTLTVTKPDGTSKTTSGYESDATGSFYTPYVPETVGNYTFQFNYLGEWMNGSRVLGDPVTYDYYKPSSSKKITITVQEEPVGGYPSYPLPTEYWTRPIDAQNRNWYTIAGNWLGVPLQFAEGYSSDGNFNPYTTAPNTGHVMWSIPQAFGGLAGGDSGDLSYYTGLSYQEKWNPPSAVIISGRLFYHKTAGPASAVTGLACVDLRTGEELWFLNGTSISFGQMWNFETANEHGVTPYLWDYRSGNSTMYDAFTGRKLLTLQGCQSASKITMSPTGDLMVYTMNAGRSWLSLWNSSKALNPTDSLDWNPSLTATYNWTRGIMWNVTIPSIPGQSIVQLGDGVIITAAGFKDITPPVRMVSGYDANTGAFLWTFNLTDYTIRPQYNFSPIIEGRFAWFKQETTQWYGYDARTGAQVWGPTEPYENSFGMYSASFRGAGGPNPQAAYGKIYTAGYDGRVHAIDIKTGNEEWVYYTGTSGFETVYGHWPFYGAPLIADDKVLITSNEHTPGSPLWRGGKLFVMNATTGEHLWNISSWMPGPIVADGYVVGLNYYDGEIYSFGKGPSAVTVEAPMTAFALGSSVVIRGTVMDIASGTKQSEQAARFPNGVPAMSDKYMSEWMEYVYMQMPRPTIATGVPVRIDVIDSNNNYRNIGTAISDASGMFTFSWKPDIEGDYKVIATFAGSESYYPSYAETSFIVDPAAQPAAAPESPQPVDPTMTIVGVGIAILIAIAIVGAIMVLMFKKRA